MNLLNKKYRLILLAIGILAILPYSCSNATDIEQNGILDADAAYRTIEDLQLGLNGVYAQYRPDSGTNGNGDAIYFNCVFTDNIKRGLDSNGQGNNLYQFLFQSGTTEALNIWSSRYSTINFANRVLEAMDALTFTDPDEILEVNNIRAQLLGMRALCHLDLFLYYTPDYSNPEGLAIINVDFVPEISDEFERNSVSETLNFMRQDLDTAFNLFDDNSLIANDVFYMRKDVIKALNAKINLLDGNYASAITIANELLTDYPLSGAVEYGLMFADAVPGEAIFSLSRTQADAAVNDIFYFNGPGLAGSPYLEVSNQLFNLYESSDVRLAATVNLTESVVIGVNDPNNILLINKYPGSGDGPTLNDIKIIRSSEILLIKAEAEARSNQFGFAQSTLQELRSIRGVTAPVPAFTNLNGALLEILNERRLELAFEGHRYLDLKRIGGEINVGINREAADCGSFDAPCTLSANDHRFTFPIPTQELQGNGNISQNPNY